MTPALIAGALTLLPWLAGHAARRGAPWVGATAALVPLPVGAWASPSDGAWWLAWLALGAATATPARALAGVLLAVGVAEAIVRVVLPPPRDIALDVSTPTLSPSWARQPAPCDLRGLQTPYGDGDRWIVHTGDSLVDGWMRGPDHAFPALLAELLPGTRHVNLAFGNTGPECALRLLRRLPPDIRPARVLIHVFFGNDVADVERPYGWCAGRTLQDLHTHGTPEQCDEPEAPPWTWTVRTTPAPFALRLAAQASALARHLALRWEAVRSTVLHPQVDAEVQRDHLVQVLQGTLNAARDRGAEPTIVVLPVRGVSPGTGAPAHDAVRARVRDDRASILAAAALFDWPVWDLTAVFDGRPGDPDAWFDDQHPHDPHFSPAGHRVIAEVEAQRLGAETP